MSDLLTAEEMASKLRVKPQTVRDWAKSGLIPAIRISHKVVRYDADAVLQSIADRQEGAGR